MLPKISLPPPTISMRTAVMLLQTQVAAAKAAPDAQTIVIEQSQAEKGLEMLLQYARTAKERATRATMSTGPATDPAALPWAAEISLAQVSALSALAAPPMAHPSPPKLAAATLYQMVSPTQNGPGSTGAAVLSGWLIPPARPSSS
ncbi:hypothetical protein [Pseudotabrizicola formosa]|uniref:hypothetical protein n=1 Tax=Pseudotabrizicola formosa TaxID=2030009 RepID=UPI000CD00ED4|nr:hypothetical protein [Pseudotabrizicola formosa]